MYNTPVHGLVNVLECPMVLECYCGWYIYYVSFYFSHVPTYTYNTRIIITRQWSENDTPSLIDNRALWGLHIVEMYNNNNTCGVYI